MNQSRLPLGGFIGVALAIAVVGQVSAEEGPHATERSAQNGAKTNTSAVAKVEDGSLSWNGITFYGTIDIGVAHQTHGAPFNKNSGQGLNYSIAKNSNEAITSRAHNGLGQSALGLKGDIALTNDLSGIFKLESGINPLSLRLANGPQSLVDNNGRGLAAQTSNSDSSRAGQLWNGAAYVGVKSKEFGTLTFGRQSGLLAEKVIEYDPNGSSYAFSLAGGAGSVQGIGATEDARLNSSLKYVGKIDSYRAGVQYQFNGKQYALFNHDGDSGSATEVDLGGDFGNFSADVIYSRKHNAISAASLSAAQLVTLPANSLTATVSDNTSYTLVGKYTLQHAKIFAGYERIRFANPSSPLSNGATDIGGYNLSVLTQNAYNVNKILDVFWTGVKFAATPKLDLTVAYYGYKQNSYSGNGCSNNGSSKCSGALNGLSLVAIYKLIQHVDVYGGVMRSKVTDGYASGYLNTSNVNAMVGGRYTF